MRGQRGTVTPASCTNTNRTHAHKVTPSNTPSVTAAWKRTRHLMSYGQDSQMTSSWPVKPEEGWTIPMQDFIPTVQSQISHTHRCNGADANSTESRGGVVVVIPAAGGLSKGTFAPLPRVKPQYCWRRSVLIHVGGSCLGSRMLPISASLTRPYLFWQEALYVSVGWLWPSCRHY